jgi:Phosphotransferase enzyme family
MIPTEIEAANSDWLTQTLRQAGTLPQGEVASVQYHDSGAFNSATSYLSLTYSPGTPATAPRQLILKLNVHPDDYNEAAFYQLAAPFAADLSMLVHCYGADYELETGKSYLLLEDLSSTHQLAVSREQLLGLQGVPAVAVNYAIIDALAQFHTYWWQHPLLGQHPATQLDNWYTNKEQFELRLARRRAEFDSFIAAEGADFPTELTSLYRNVLAKFASLWPRYIGERFSSFSNLTLAHGDFFINQPLVPRQMPGQVYMIDFDSVSTSFGATDLVYCCVHFQTAAQRHEGGREVRLLRRYHAALQKHGVSGYSWEQLLLDYRLMLIFRMFEPVWDETNGTSKQYWWPKLQCVATAFQDWGCAELLEE